MVFCAKQLNSLNIISKTFVVSFIFEIVTTETPKPCLLRGDCFRLFSKMLAYVARSRVPFSFLIFPICTRTKSISDGETSFYLQIFYKYLGTEDV